MEAEKRDPGNEVALEVAGNEFKKELFDQAQNELRQLRRVKSKIRGVNSTFKKIIRI